MMDRQILLRVLLSAAKFSDSIDKDFMGGKLVHRSKGRLDQEQAYTPTDTDVTFLSMVFARRRES